jgi:drug/metabolite transporter (DMT)-like permease
MPILFVFISVGVIWSTTPLAIQWSALGSTPWFALASRMLLGLIFCLLILLIKRQKLSLSKKAILNYFVASLGIWVTMSLIYWSSQTINSGFISVVFGFTPIVTGVFAMIILKEKPFSLFKNIGIFLSIVGLWSVFNHSLSLNYQGFIGLSLVFVGMSFQSGIAVVMKRINANTSALETTTGALLLSVPVLLLIWFFVDGEIPDYNFKTYFSILYLAFFASVIGFMGYYHLIKHLNASQVGLMPLITPVFALLMGYLFNNEILSLSEFIGVFFILLGLFVYQFGKIIYNKLFK